MRFVGIGSLLNVPDLADAKLTLNPNIECLALRSSKFLLNLRLVGPRLVNGCPLSRSNSKPFSHFKGRGLLTPVSSHCCAELSCIVYYEAEVIAKPGHRYEERLLIREIALAAVHHRDPAVGC